MKIRIVIAFCLVALVGSGCGGSLSPQKREIFGTALRAVKADAGFPKDAKPAGMGESTVQVLKSGARVDIPYAYTDASGKTAQGSYTVWLKNFHHSWQVDRCAPTPTYPDKPTAK
jgi:hypothetical protein